MAAIQDCAYCGKPEDLSDDWRYVTQEDAAEEMIFCDEDCQKLFLARARALSTELEQILQLDVDPDTPEGQDRIARCWEEIAEFEERIRDADDAIPYTHWEYTIMGYGMYYG